MAVDLGKIGQTLKGEFDNSQVYERLDVVSDNGSSYVSIIDENTLPVTNPLGWQVNALKGSDGQDGPPGITPVISIGSTITLDPSESAIVTDTGTISNPIFNFGIPKGEKGDDGLPGTNSVPLYNDDFNI